MNMSDIANNAKITLIWRVCLGICSILGTLGVAAIFGYVRSSDAKLTQTASDVAQIKWELPVIKETAIRDKQELMAELRSQETQLQTMRNLGDIDRKEINDLKTSIALLKMKLQLP